MVAVLLLILKIIGILLLSVLGLVLVLLLLVLFWPIGYRLTGDMPDPEHRKVCLRVRWLSVLVRFLLVLDDSGDPGNPGMEESRKRESWKEEQT